ncbi:MAG TPA: peptidoglycan DD-metalloendopeptidase family protein [Candidatus Binatia bacterium]|nr:peptidoglycan DD-metalloendopeptidase family protein [Candidatus Binatia bacterium]
MRLTAIIAPAARARKPALALGAALLTLAASRQPSPEELSQVRSRIEQVQQTLAQDRTQHDDLRAQVEGVERKSADLAAALAEVEQRLAQQHAQLKATRTQRAEAEASLTAQRQALGRQLRAAYVIGQRGQAKLLLNQNGAQQVSRVMTYYEYLNRARTGHIQDILGQARTLEAVEARLAQETSALEVTRSERQGTLTAMEATRAERDEMLKALAARIASEEDELKALRASERELARLLTEIQGALADIPAHLGARPLAQMKGRLPWPLKGRLLARYGDYKAGGQLRWNGLWIEGREGDPVKAVARGRVAYVGWMHRYGLIAVLEHEGGYYTLYGHAQNVAVNVGDWVNAGDAVVTAGSTGGHTKSGIYFELRKGPEAVNPRPWLRRG